MGTKIRVTSWTLSGKMECGYRGIYCEGLFRGIFMGVNVYYMVVELVFALVSIIYT